MRQRQQCSISVRETQKFAGWCDMLPLTGYIPSEIRANQSSFFNSSINPPRMSYPCCQKPGAEMSMPARAAVS